MSLINKLAICFSTSLFVLLANGGNQIQAQSLETPQVSASQQVAQDDPTSYAAILAKIQANEQQINHLFSSMPIGFPEKQKQHLDDIKLLKSENESLASKLDAAAVKAYQADPRGNAKAGSIVFKQITQKLDPIRAQDKFDPQGALEIADLMMKAGFDTEQTMAVQFKDVAYQAFRASYAIQDFGRAELMLKKIADQGVKFQPETAQKLEVTREKWKRELMIRRLENNTDDLPIVQFETTKGTFVVELFENHAPETVGNFISLVEKKFYDDMPFFLVQPGRFAQTGCPVGNGTGDAGYKIPCECYREQIREHFTGTLSMANAGRDTGGTQFFISHQPNAQWDGRYTAFGRVKEGMNVVYQLQTIDKSKPTTSGEEPSRIVKVTVIRKRNHIYGPTRVAQSTEKSGDTIQNDGGLVNDGQ